MRIHVFQKNVFYQGLFARLKTGWIGFNWEKYQNSYGMKLCPDGHQG